MFNVSSLQSGFGGWFSGAVCRKPRARGCSEAGWGACIDVSAQCRAEDMSFCVAEANEFRDGDVLLDEHGLHVLGRGGRAGSAGYGHILASAQRASAPQDLTQDCSDVLSEASTQDVSDAYDVAAREHFMRSVSGTGWRSPDGTAARSRSGSVRLSGLGIKRFSIKQTSPKAAPQGFGSGLAGMGMLALGEAALPGLTTSGLSVHATNFKVPRSSLSEDKHGAQGSGRKLEIQFSDIRKVKLIGKGNSAAVWRCENTSTKAPLAVKQLQLGCDQVRRSMAVRELVTMYGVDHAHIVTCHNVFYSNNFFHLVMELMDGGSLLDAMKRTQALSAPHSPRAARSGMPLAALATLALDVLHALKFLHDDLQVIHRDVKPGNILLSTSGVAKLGDLGIATLPGELLVDARGDAAALDLAGTSAASSSCPTTAVEWIGTMTYMSPERLSGDSYSFSADIWSLGLVLLEAALGRYPLVQVAAAVAASAPAASSASCFSSNTTTAIINTAGASSKDGKGSPLEFWDLLDLVSNGPCPSLLLAHRSAASDGATTDLCALQSLAAACLIKDGAKRPCARELLLLRSDGAHLCAGVASSSSANCNKCNNQGQPSQAHAGSTAQLPASVPEHFLSKARPAALAAWVQSSLGDACVRGDVDGGSEDVESTPAVLPDLAADLDVGYGEEGEGEEIGIMDGIDEALKGLVDEEGSEAEGWL